MKIFIRKKTKCLLSALKDIGYKICPCCYLPTSVWLEASPGSDEFVHGIGYTDETYPKSVHEVLDLFLRESKDYIDCGKNESIFMALANYKDYTDNMQLFINDKGDYFVHMDDGYEFYTIPEVFDIKSYHKATPEELIKFYSYE